MSGCEFFGSFKYLYLYFKVVGWWQNKTATKLYRAYGIMLHMVGVDLLLLFQLMYLFIPSTLLEVTELLCVISIYISLSLKSLNVIIRLEKIINLVTTFKDLIALLETDEKSSLPHLKRRMNKLFKIYKIYSFFTNAAVFFGGIVPLVSYFNPPFKLSYKMWSPFDYDTNEMWFAVIASYQFISSVVFSMGSVSLDTLTVFFFQAATGLLEELAEKIKSLDSLLDSNITVESSKQRESNGTQLAQKVKSRGSKITFENQKKFNEVQELQKCIALQIKIRRFIREVEETFSPLIFEQGAMSSLIICTIMFQMSKVH